MNTILHFPTLVFSFVFAFGLCWGSFVNVVIHRLPLGEDIVFPRSACPKCKALIPWYRNIPLVSFLFLRGKCGDCGTKISFRYPLVELITGFLFTAVAYSTPNFLEWPFGFYFLASLVACTFIDIDHWILPDKITLPGILVGFASSIVAPNALLQSGPGNVLAFSFGWNPILGSFLDSVIGMLVGGGILYLVAWGYQVLANKDGLGGGDIKFLAMAGAFLGTKGALVTLVLSSILGSLIGIFLIAFRGKKSGTAIQFGPFLSIGAATAFFFGDLLWQWYFDFR